MNTRFYSNGKLLLTGEYIVLDGSLSLAVPTNYGQSLIVEKIDEPKLIWKSENEKGFVWFEETFLLIDNKISCIARNDNDISERLVQILNAANKLNPQFLNTNQGYKISAKLDFPRNWGLGTSSTLINNIAQWAGIDAYKLLELTFGGSGYDIACAQNNQPIIYQIQNNKPIVKEVNFNPSFKENLYFVHLNKKQNSRDGIKQYHAKKENSKFAISEINELTNKIINSKTLEDFESLINTHETIISKITKQMPVKQQLFDDFNGSIKSLGAWGGDFILVTSKTNPREYFEKKGFETALKYTNMVL